MAVTPASFRQIYTEFKDPLKYTDLAINNWTSVALMLLDPCRWDVMLDQGTMLYVAHKLVLSRRAFLASVVGGTPGATVGPLMAKAIDKVSSSYDTKAISQEGAGIYNSTSYGIELWQLMLQFGAGPLQETKPWGDPSNQDGGGFWFGVF